MLVWMCALHCEAKPIIDFYRLIKSPDKTEFDCYENNDISCIVSGMGANNMMQAIHWVNNRLNKNTTIYWINLGIAGHQTLSIGSSILVNKASQADNLEPIFTTTKVTHNFTLRPVISITQEQTNYDAVALFDMEAYTFLQATHQLSSIDNCQSIKVISDNKETPPTRNKAKISQMISGNMQPISAFAKQLQNN